MIRLVLIWKNTLKEIKPEIKTKELHISLTQVSTSIYFLEVTTVLNLLIGGYKISIATDYQKNLITKMREENGQGIMINCFSYTPQNYKKIPCRPVIKSSPTFD